MADRRVTRTRKDADVDITASCNPDADWSPRSKTGAIADIEGGTHTYYVFSGTTRVNIHVVHGASGKYLRTDPDSTSRNNLDDHLQQSQRGVHQQGGTRRAEDPTATGGRGIRRTYHSVFGRDNHVKDL